MAAIASAHSVAVVRPGASAPASDSLWLGKSNARTGKPCLDQRFDEHCQMRSLAAPTVYQIYRRPLTPFLTSDPMPIPIRFYRPARGHTRRHAQLDSRTRGVHHNSTAHRDPKEGANRSSSQNNRRTRTATGGRTSEPTTSSGPTSPACADSGPDAPSVINRDHSTGRPVSALRDIRALGAGHRAGLDGRVLGCPSRRGVHGRAPRRLQHPRGCRRGDRRLQPASRATRHRRRPTPRCYGNDRMAGGFGDATQRSSTPTSNLSTVSRQRELSSSTRSGSC